MSALMATDKEESLDIEASIKEDSASPTVYGDSIAPTIAPSVNASTAYIVVDPTEEILDGTAQSLNDHNTSAAEKLLYDAPAADAARPRQWMIETLAARDDVDLLKPWKRYIYFLSSFLAVAAFATYILYFGFRIHCTIAAQNVNRTSYPAAWIFIAIEIGVATPVLFHSLWSVFVLKSRGRQKLRLRGDNVPTVDILITCCGEDDDLVLNTARAACNIDYPRDRFRVIVLDDGKSFSLFRVVAALHEQYPNLIYRTRDKRPGLPHHFKAGNLNYGLEQTWSVKGKVGEFVAALDADMIPQPEWLRAMLPHMLADSKCGLACPPQMFYNVPPSDPLYQSLDFFIHISEPIKDAVGVSWCTGSGYIARRSALNDIGQIPTGSVAEDVLTSTLLLGDGWRTCYVHEPLQYGTVPDDFGGHIKQRTRWTVGTMQTAGRLRFSLWGSEIRKLTLAQRISGLMYAVTCLCNVILMLSLFAIPSVLMSGGRLIAYVDYRQLRWLIRACWLAFMVNRLSEVAMFLPSGYLTGQRGMRAILWMAPYHTITMLRVFVLPTWLGGHSTSFKPTGSLTSELKERNARERAPLHRRLKVILWNYFAGLHLIFIVFVIAAVIRSSMRCAQTQIGRNDTLICLLTHAFWPPLSWLVYIAAAWTPVIYAIRPPSMPDMEQLLERDEARGGVAYPKEESKKVKTRWMHSYFEMQYTLMTVYVTVMFAGTWIY